MFTMTTEQGFPTKPSGEECALRELERAAQATFALPSPAARREIRKRAGLTLDQLAGAVGVTRTCIWLWETNQRNPSPAYRVRYARALAVAERYAE
jgi:DNA-binding XRE family transcriptional regulator